MSLNETYPIGEVIRYDEKSPCPLVAKLPHYHLVPKDPAKHREWRLWLRKEAASDPAFQQQLRRWCEEDPLFFINSLLWIDEPREGEGESGLIPFNTWCHQDPVIAALHFNFGKRHAVIDKSRAQGASWLILGLYLHKFLFRPRTYLGMASRSKELADAPDAPESLGWKFDHLISWLPKWLTHDADGKPIIERSLSLSTWTNRLNGSTLKAHGATKDIGRGGRYVSYFLDESSFFVPGGDSEAVSGLVSGTNGIILSSTPNGESTEHAKRLDNPGPWLSLILDWTNNPSQNRGLYTVRNGEVIKLDKHPFPPGYYPVMDELFPTRSPWFDRYAQNNGNSVIWINRELNRDRGGSRAKPFDIPSIEVAEKLCLPPIHAGQLLFEDYDLTDFTWLPGGTKAWSLWIELQGERPPAGQYVVGADIAAGAGGDTSSNSVLSFWDIHGSQVASFARHDIKPTEFARLAYAAMHWFAPDGRLPLIVPERNAIGMTFLNELVAMNYPNIYRMPKQAGKETGPRGKTYGYHNASLHNTLSPFINGLLKRTVTPRDAALLVEASQYIFDGDGRVIHPKSRSAEEGSSRGENHGDKVVAAALAIRGIQSLGGLKPATKPKRTEETISKKALAKAPPTSFAHCLWLEQQERRRSRAGSFEF